MAKILNNINVEDYGYNDITLRGIGLNEIEYQSLGYEYVLNVTYRNEKGNDCGYRKTYFKTKEEVKEHLKSILRHKISP